MRYALADGECEVRVQGRLGDKPSNATAWLKESGAIRIDDMANPEMWAELYLPDEYILAQAERINQRLAFVGSGSCKLPSGPDAPQDPRKKKAKMPQSEPGAPPQDPRNKKAKKESE